MIDVADSCQLLAVKIACNKTEQQWDQFMHISSICVMCGASEAATHSMFRRLVHTVQHYQYSAAAVRG